MYLCMHREKIRCDMLRAMGRKTCVGTTYPYKRRKGEGLCPLLSIFFTVSFIERQSRVL